MSIQSVYDFNTPTDYTKVNTQVTGGVGKLDFESAAGSFSEDFADDTDFIYNASYAEFVGGVVRQKDARTAGISFYAAFTSSVDASWSTGSPTGTPTNATVTAGKLDLRGGDLQRFVEYSAVGNANNAQTTCVRFKLTPNYSGNPAFLQDFVTIFESLGSTNNVLDFFHLTNGDLNFRAYAASGASIFVATLGNWNPTAGQTYEIELNWDLTTGASRCFIDGVQKGATQTGTGTRSTGALLLRFGQTSLNSATILSDFQMDEIAIFPAVQHTANYTLGYSISEFVYRESKVDLPLFTHPTSGFINSLSSLTVSDSNSPRYIVGGKYWNGSAWVASDGSFAQSNSPATINAHITALNVASTQTLQVSVVFQDTNTQASCTDLAVAYLGDFYSASGSLTPAQALNVKDIVAFSATVNEPTSTNARFVLDIDGVHKYWDGGAWSTSDDSLGQSNTAAEIDSNAAALVLGSNSTVNIVILLFSSDPTATPSISAMTITYDFGGIIAAAQTCLVWGYYKDISGNPVSGAAMSFALKRNSKQYKEAADSIIEKAVNTTTDVNGYFEMDLIRSSEFEGSGVYQLSVVKTADSLETSKTKSGKVLSFSVPDADEKNITDILTAG